MNDKYLRDIVLNFMLAGRDTSAGTLSWFFYMLCKNPLIQEKVAEEVRQIVGVQWEEADINLFVQSLTDSALDKMHYLHAALTETLRLYPAVPVVSFQKQTIWLNMRLNEVILTVDSMLYNMFRTVRCKLEISLHPNNCSIQI